MSIRCRKAIVAPYLLVLLIVFFCVASCRDDSATQKQIQNNATQGIKEKILQLSPGYLKEIPGSSGVVIYQDNTRGAFVGRVELRGLTKGSYLMTMNENNQFPIGRKLTGWRTWGNEQYIDFEQIYIDDSGSYKGGLEVNLPPGNYTLKFFVKEVGGSFPSVLYNNLLKLQVQ